MTYDSSTKLVNYQVVVPDNSYLGLGYGTSMTDTDMVIFQANGESSMVEWAYSTGHSTPTPNTGTCYTLESQSLNSTSDRVTMEVSRPLECAGENSFVIPLGTSFDIVNAWLTTTYEVKFHGESNFKSGATFLLNEDGTCA